MTSGVTPAVRTAPTIMPMIPPKETISDPTTKMTPKISSKPRNEKYAFFTAVKLAPIEFNPDTRDSDANHGARPSNGVTTSITNDTNKFTMLATTKYKYIDDNIETARNTIDTKPTSTAEMSVCT